MEITPQRVKELREKTGAGMMDCKNALNEAGGDEEKAIDLLRKKGLSRVEKRSGREAKEGLVEAYVSADGRLGVLVEVDCETDFVAKTDDFRSLVAVLKDAVVTAAKAPSTIDDVLEIKSGGKILKDLFTDTASKLGENLIFRRFCRVEIPAAKAGYMDTYIHTGAKLGVLLHLETGSAEAAARPELRTMARDISLHIAAASPLNISRNEIAPELVEKEKEIYRGQIEAEGKKKPPEVVEKIITGKLEKFFAEVALLEQVSVKTPDKTIGNLVAETAQKIGSDIQVVRFYRFKIGE